jgi:hypothetical protein
MSPRRPFVDRLKSNGRSIRECFRRRMILWRARGVVPRGGSSCEGPAKPARACRARCIAGELGGVTRKTA